MRRGLGEAESVPPVLVAWTTGRSPGRSSADELIRRLVAARIGVSERRVTVARHCPRCGSAQHGRPIVSTPAGPPVRASISRTRGHVLVALSMVGPVGVDAEAMDGALRGVSDLLLHEDEAATAARDLATIWVRKESLLKATGQGLSAPMTDIRVSGPGAAAQVLAWRGRDRRSYDAISMSDFALGAHVVGCVSVITDAPLKISLIEVDREVLLG